MEDAPEVRFERLKGAIQDAILRSFPNPERKGCPGDEVVREVAGRREPVEDDAFQHITHCSPCYAAFLQFKDEFRIARRRRGLGILLGAVAVVVTGGAVTIYQVMQQGEIPALPAAKAFEVASLDLRSTSSVRGVEGSEASAVPLSLPRKRLDLTIYLPFGSEPGTYEIRLVRSDTVAVTVPAASAFDQGIVALRSRVDTSGFLPGEYALGVRKGTRDWIDYRITLR